jgi:lipopolysaccharide export system permease protein
MILHRYFARRFAMSLGMVTGLFVMLLGLIDLIEQARRHGGQAAGFGEILSLAALNLPQAVYGILPLIVIVAAVSLFLSLARSSELVVVRAAGRSALRTLIAPLAVILGIGVLSVLVLNPIVAATSRAYEARLAALSGEGTSFALSGDSVWLRQGSPLGQTVIRADRAGPDGTELWGVSFLSFGPDGTVLRRIEAAAARLTEGAWEMTEAKIWPLSGAANPETEAERAATYSIPSNLTAQQIRDSFGSPSSIPVWELPAFIAELQAAGFSARRHVMFLQKELSLPAFLAALVLVAAAFTMRPQRGGRTGLMVLGAILTGFGLHVLRNFAQVLGEAGEVPPALAAWAPPVATILLAIGLILHLEDG